MAKKKKKLKRLLIALPIALVFILIINLCDQGILPQQLQKPLDAFNNATDGLLYQKKTTKALSVHFIDVGQGDSTLISCEGKYMLIDGGTSDVAQKVENYLESQGVESLSYVVGTHPHDDHIGGLVGVLGKFHVDNVILSGATTTTNSFKRLLNTISDKKYGILQAKIGNIYNLGGAKFTILAPLAKYDELNDMSVVIRLTYKNTSFLFMGDASSISERDMLSKYKDLSADVIKIGHHGSKTASSTDFLKAVHPSIAVISVGRDNSYGLPSNEVVRRVKDSGAKLFRTDYDGTVVIESDGKKLSYKEEK